MPQTVFERVEKKYLLTPLQCSSLLEHLRGRLVPDEFGLSTVCSLYADTPDFLLIRRSLEKPAYKEKLRLRTYELPTENSTCFLELKKKLNGVVYKRRLTLPYPTALRILNGQWQLLPNTQIGRELLWFLQSYRNLRPAAVVCCERQAFFSAENRGLRFTFDRRLTAGLWQETHTPNRAGRPLLPPGAVLLELKTAESLPLWLCRTLSALEIYPTSFSKYGTLYRNYILKAGATPKTGAQNNLILMEDLNHA